jgi:hypothetical protein
MDDKLKNIISNSLSVENFDINNIDNQNCTKILYLIIGLILKSSLDDIESYSYFKILFKNTTLSINTYDKVKDLLEIINEGKYKLTHKILTSKYNKDIYTNKFKKNIKNFKNSDGKIKHIFQIDNDNIDEYKKIIVYNLQLIIKAFDEKKFINGLRCPPYNKQNIWECINSYEIEIRFKQMVEMFGIDLLKNWKIKIVPLIDFNNMEFKEKVKYYIKSCKKLSGKLNDYKNDILIYKSINDIFNNLITKDINELEDDIDVVTSDSSYNSSDEEYITYSDLDDYDISSIDNIDSISYYAEINEIINTDLNNTIIKDILNTITKKIENNIYNS